MLTIGSFLLTVELFYLQSTILAFLLPVGAFLLTILASLPELFAYSGKVRLIRALRDCKQGSSTVRKKAPTVSKSEAPKRGRKKGAARKLSKSVEKLFDVFCPARKLSKNFLTLFDDF